jgi:hypothetical protein
MIFQEIPKDLPPYRDHEHQIELIPESTPNKRPYRYPHRQKGEIKKMVQDMLYPGGYRWPPTSSSWLTYNFHLGSYSFYLGSFFYLFGS